MSRNTVRHFFQCLPRMNFTKDCFVGNQSLTYRSLPKITLVGSGWHRHSSLWALLLCKTAVPHTTYPKEGHAHVNVTLILGPLKDSTAPAQKALKKLIKAMITRFPKNIIHRRARNINVPLWVTLKRGKTKQIHSSSRLFLCLVRLCDPQKQGRHEGEHTDTFSKPREAQEDLPAFSLIWQERNEGWLLPCGTRNTWVGALGIFLRSRITCHTPGTTPNHPDTLLSRICTCQIRITQFSSTFLQEPLRAFWEDNES